jgi:LytS/YehU family sensor histidine kinase
MRRPLVWLQLVIGWLPVWALYAVLMSTVHRVPFTSAALVAMRAILVAAAFGLIVQRLTEWWPWPHPFRARFLAFHLIAATIYAMAWQLATGLVEALWYAHAIETALAAFPFIPFLVTGVWLYIMVAGVSYATHSAERAARAEAMAARSQLAALRAHLNPHFLFNALHTIVQLIPDDPRAAGQAAERLADLLRTTIAEDRDLVPLAEECAFVERYLALERLRFGDRLRVLIDVTAEAADALIPCFALQTLVENAVRHGAEPQVEPTSITVRGRTAHGDLLLTVEDTGVGVAAKENGLRSAAGTGLQRLRNRMAVLYGRGARLELTRPVTGGCRASLVLPLAAPDPVARVMTAE